MTHVLPAELIVDIREVENMLVEKEVVSPSGYTWMRQENWQGWEVETDQQIIRVMIGNDHDCCEVWGYFATNDDVKDYIGTLLRGIAVVDDRLNVEYNTPGELESWEYDDPDEGRGTSTFFVNFETDRGVFQLAVYNNHNGYYGHKVKLASAQFTEESKV